MDSCENLAKSCHNLEKLWLSRLTPKAIDDIKNFKNLKELAISQVTGSDKSEIPDITKEDIKKLESLPQLEVLRVSYKDSNGKVQIYTWHRPKK